MCSPGARKDLPSDTVAVRSANLLSEDQRDRTTYLAFWWTHRQTAGTISNFQRVSGVTSATGFMVFSTNASQTSGSPWKMPWPVYCWEL